MAFIHDAETEERQGRGRRPDPAKDQAILDAARDLFLEKGYGASVDEIAERAGVVKQTVYARFRSKEELFAAVVRAVADELLSPIATAPAGRPRETLTAIAELYKRMILEHDRIQMLRLMIAQSGQFPDLAKKYFENGPYYVHRRLADYLDKEKAAGVLHIDDVDLAASQFFGLIKGVEHLGVLLGVQSAETELQRRRRVAGAVDAFLKLYDA